MEDAINFKKRLIFSEARFEAIARTATDSIIISNENSIILFVNKKSCETFGYEEEELLGREMGILMPEKYRDSHTAGVKRYIGSGVPTLIGYTIEIEGLRKDGSVFPLELSLSSWKEGESYFFSGIIRDITRRRQLSKEREENNQRLLKKQRELELANEEQMAMYEEFEAANEELRSSQAELSAANNKLTLKEKMLKEWNSELEQKVVERTLKLKEAHRETVLQGERLNDLFMQASAPIVILDGPDLVYELINPAYQQIFPGRKLLGKPLLEALPELEGSPVPALLRKAYATGETYVAHEMPLMLSRYEGKPPEEIFWTFTYQARYDKKGTINGVIVFAYDVTGQVEARRKAQESEQSFRTLLESILHMTWTSTPTGEINFYNRRWYEYTGLTFEESKDWGWQLVVHPDDLASSLATFKHALQTGSTLFHENRFKCSATGVYRWHLNQAVPLRNKKGEITLWVGTATDIHEQKQLEEMLLQTSKELKNSNQELSQANQQLLHINADLDNFIYTASHDLKAPIANIEGLLNSLLRSVPTTALKVGKTKQIIGMMEGSIERFKNTISILTDITRLQKESIEESTSISLSDTIDDVVLDLQPMIEACNVKIERQIEECSFIYFSQKNLRSIIYNLLSNAIKYHSPDRIPLVQIRCSQTTEHSIISVRDNGLGMKSADIPKIFSMFKRLHNHVDGSGIGMFMVKRIIDNAGGMIEVKSKVGEGSTFEVYLKR